MKLNQLPNFRVEDFPGQGEWIGKLFTQLNPFIQAVNQVLDLNVDFSSNIRSVTREYSLSGFQEFSLSWPYRLYPPAEVRVIKAQKGSALTPTIILPAWSYDSTNTLIKINNLLEAQAGGLTSLSGTYKLWIRASV